jgi:AcrR family transcriptional regulator
MAAAQPPSTLAPEAEPRRSDKWYRRRDEVIDRSAKVFAEQGFHGTSTVELCEANELGKGALYYYIGSKDELLTTIIDRVMDAVLEGATRAATSEEPPAERLRALGREYLEVIMRYPDHVWVFLHEFPALTGDNAKALRARRRSFEELVEKVLADGAASGAFSVEDPRLTSRAWLGMHNYTYLWLRPGGELSAADVADHFADVFLQGIDR